MNRLFLAVMVVVILFATGRAKGLSCPPMWGKFNETTLDLVSYL